MIDRISIRNFAIIERLDLDLNAGLTVISGETGAGKSIVFDALSLALGERADMDMIRHGCDRAEVNCQFNISQQPNVADWLKAEDLDEDGNCEVRRVLRASGSSAAWINGHKVSLGSLKQLGDFLVDIHGQHEHQSLMRRTAQRDILDRYGNCQAASQTVATLWHAWHDAKQSLDALENAARDRNERIDFLRFQQSEFEQVDPQPNESEQLEQEHRTQANAGAILAACQQAGELLYDAEDGSAYSQLGSALRAIESLGDPSSEQQEAMELINSALVQTQEASDSLRHYAERIDQDPQRLSWLDERLGALHDLARKHHVDSKELCSVRERIDTELAQIENADEVREDLIQQVEKYAIEYRQAANALSQLRSQASGLLGDNVSEVMRPLGMPESIFVAAINSDENRFSIDGFDQVEFLVSMNPGQPPKPLTRVASGGELSRVSLALQVIAADAISTPCLVFDEVDSGIGGGVAEIVGRKLRDLGHERQVLCITHLPQVASHGHQHLHVRKQTNGETTETTMVKLNDQERTNEVARMLGGVELTDQSRAHAQEMLERAGA